MLDTRNRFLVGLSAMSQGAVCVGMRPGAMTRDEAVMLAAWLAAMAGTGRGPFDYVIFANAVMAHAVDAREHGPLMVGVYHDAARDGIVISESKYPSLHALSQDEALDLAARLAATCGAEGFRMVCEAVPVVGNQPIEQVLTGIEELYPHQTVELKNDKLRSRIDADVVKADDVDGPETEADEPAKKKAGAT